MAGTKLFKESRSVKVVVLMVAEFIAPLKAPVTAVEVLTPVAPFVGETEVTVGPEAATTVNVVLPVIPLSVAEMFVLPATHPRGQPRTGDSGHPRIRRSPGHRTGQVLGAPVGIRPRGRELLGGSHRNRGIRRRHGDRRQGRTPGRNTTSTQ